MWIVKKKPILGQATDQMFNLLINLMQLAENLLSKLLNGPPTMRFRHGESEARYLISFVANPFGEREILLFASPQT